MTLCRARLGAGKPQEPAMAMAVSAESPDPALLRQAGWGREGQCGETPGTRNVRINLEIDFRILLRLIRFCADLQLTTVRTGLVTLPSEERDKRGRTSADRRLSESVPE